ncbi:MAG: twin-arginine translocation signal domain-containing protein, partial [Chthoniobacteraceae bacterium]
MSHSRRTFLRQAGVAAVAATVGLRARGQSAPAITIEDTRVISLDPQYYHGWPTVALRKNGDLIVSWSGGRDGHICRFGRVDAMVSHDQGATWQWPQTLLDSPMDDRDSGVLETAKGTL